MTGLRHHDPAAQLRARGTAELPQQACLGAAGVRGVATEPVVVVAGDQQPLIGGGAANHPRDKLKAVAPAWIGIGRARVTEDSGAGPAADRNALYELRGLV